MRKKRALDSDQIPATLIPRLLNFELMFHGEGFFIRMKSLFLASTVVSSNLRFLHARDFLRAFQSFFWHRSIFKESPTEDLRNFLNYFSNSYRYSKISNTQRYCRKRTAYICDIAENAQINLVVSA